MAGLLVGLTSFNSTANAITPAGGTLTVTGALTVSGAISGASLNITSLLAITSDGTLVTVLPATGDYLRFGDAGTTSHSFASNDDVVFSGQAEFNSSVFFDGSTFLATDSQHAIGGGNECRIVYTATGTDTLQIGLGTASRTLMVCDTGDIQTDYSLAVATHPTVKVFSATAAATATNQWIAISHNATDPVISSGTGTLILPVTHSALAAETVSGYITIKDAGGTSRKVAVVT